jgi:hypothetical protein
MVIRACCADTVTSLITMLLALLRPIFISFIVCIYKKTIKQISPYSYGNHLKITVRTVSLHCSTPSARHSVLLAYFIICTHFSISVFIVLYKAGTLLLMRRSEKTLRRAGAHTRLTQNSFVRRSHFVISLIFILVVISLFYSLLLPIFA